MGTLPQPGEMFGRYEILRRIGRGGMGVVYAARQRGLDREVALKLLSPELSESEEYRRRFEREASALARLESPHVISVYDADEHDSWLFIATQLVPDGDLGSWLHQHGPFEPEVALEILGQVAQGLAAAHEIGILHRDIKPGNVLLRRGSDGSLHAYLCDFGIALDEGSEHTKTTGVIGTLGYMAPERHLGEPASVASDVYALGCLLYAMLTGTAPYTGTDFTVASAHLNDPVRQLDDGGELASGINGLLSDTMAKDPGSRLASPSEVSRGVHAVLAGVTSATAVPEELFSVSDAIAPTVPQTLDATGVSTKALSEPGPVVEETRIRQQGSTPPARTSAEPGTGRKRRALLGGAALLAAGGLIAGGYLAFLREDAPSSLGEDPPSSAVALRVGAKTFSSTDVNLVADLVCGEMNESRGDVEAVDLSRLRFEAAKNLLDTLVIEEAPALAAGEKDPGSASQTVKQMESSIARAADPVRLREILERVVRAATGVGDVVAAEMSSKYKNLTQERGQSIAQRTHKRLIEDAAADHPAQISDAYDTNRDGKLTDGDQPQELGETCG